MRAFVAIDLPVPDLQSKNRDPSKAPTHLTLRFLGEVSPETIPDLRAALAQAVVGFSPFVVHLRGVGAFPHAKNPRVLWIGIEEGKEELRELAMRIARSLERIGLPPEPRPLVPHLTILRVRGGASLKEAQRRLAEEASREFGSYPVSEILLKESRLTSEGPVHSVLERIPLPGPSRDRAPESSVPPER